MTTKCTECLTKKGTFRSRLERTLCSECSKLDKYTLITKTNCKNIYLLSENDLSGVVFYEGKCVFGGGIISTFYSKTDVIERACVKYNTTPQELYNVLQTIKNNKKSDKIKKQLIKEKKEADMRVKRKEKLIEILTEAELEYDNFSDVCQEYIIGTIKCKPNELIELITTERTEKINMMKRKQKLIKALTDVGVTLRSDSVLCKQYIDGESEYTVKEIAKRMAEMKYLFEYCHMKECKKKAYNELNNCNYYDPYYNEVLFDIAEKTALKKYSNGEYPTIFPWQVQEI